MALLYFILGILFISIIVPIVESLSSWLLTWIESKKAKQNEIINQLNIKMQRDAELLNDVPHSQSIGFYVPEANENEEEYEHEI